MIPNIIGGEMVRKYNRKSFWIFRNFSGHSFVGGGGGGGVIWLSASVENAQKLCAILHEKVYMVYILIFWQTFTYYGRGGGGGVVTLIFNSLFSALALI